MRRHVVLSDHLCSHVEVRRVEIVLARDADKVEKSIAPRIRQRSAYAPWGGCIADSADWPLGREPFARGMRQRRRETDNPGLAVDLGRLNGCNLVPA